MSEQAIPDKTAINDIRMGNAFKGISFSTYKLTEVRKQFIENMNKGKIEPACYWCAELICSGHYPELWECIFYFVGKYIHIGNPKIAIYLERRYDVFKNIMHQRHFNIELDLRNNSTIRTMFAEIVVVLSQSTKKPSFETIKIDREEEFDMTVIKERFKATDTSFAQTVFDTKDDPKELFIAINEFAYHVGGPKPNMQESCYWIEWVIEFDLICRKRKQKCKCKRRVGNVESKYQCDSIWLVWDVLLYYCDAKPNPEYIKTLMTSLRELFCAKYSLGTSKKRKYLLYFAVELLTEHVPTNVDLVGNKEVLQTVISKIHDIYKQIKKEEISPKTEYLFKDTKSTNLENSIAKMNMLTDMDFVPRKDP